jgi:RimJ/RimL family protein N-acetyltransferase
MPRIPSKKQARPKFGFSTSGKPIACETERFKLRTVTPADASPAYLGWIADAEVMTPLNMPARALTLGDLANHISAFDNQNRFLVGMFDKDTGTHFGIFLIDASPQHRLAKLSFLIGEDAFRGVGALREAAAGLITHLFTARGFEKVAAQVIVGNEPSIAALEALGFEREGTMRGEIRSFRPNGGRLDQYFYGLLRDDWKKKQAR